MNRSSFDDYANDIKSDYEHMSEQKILSEGMTEKEFGELLEMNVKSYDQRMLLKKINELRPGWVTNLRLAEAMEDYFIKGKVWAVENPTDADFAKHIPTLGTTVSTLDIAALIDIGHEYRKVYDEQQKRLKEWYK